MDVGCGEGTVSRDLAQHGRVVLAFDVDMARLRRARSAPARGEPHPGPRLFLASADAIPLADGSVASAVAGEVLEHLPDDVLAVAEVARVLAPGGVLVITVPAGAVRYGRFDAAVGHHRRYDRADLVALVRGAALDLAVVRGWGFPIGRAYDRLILRPALENRYGSPASGPGVRALRGWLTRAFAGLFALEERVPAGDLGSGWLAVARKPGRHALPGGSDAVTPRG